MADEEDNNRSTYEQAKCCPKCGRPGEVRKIRVAQDLPWGTKIHEIYCVTELCIWFDTPWFVQVNADGSIPAPTSHIGEKKIYEGFEGHDEQAVHVMNQLHAMEQIKATGEFDEISLNLDPDDPFGTKKSGKH